MTARGVQPIHFAETTTDSNRLGLCETCVAHPRCTLRKERTVCIVCCEEFDDGSRPGGASGPSLRLHESDAFVASAPRSESPLRGLCANCAHVATCQFPRPEGGVWHCEEYK